MLTYSLQVESNFEVSNNADLVDGLHKVATDMTRHDKHELSKLWDAAEKC